MMECDRIHGNRLVDEVKRNDGGKTEGKGKDPAKLTLNEKRKRKARAPIKLDS